jgi:hypothetical protein
VNGAETLGCPRGLFIVSAVLVSAFIVWGLVVYWQRDRACDHLVGLHQDA